jgi:rhamnogalacturonyl hydrolase YesR
VYTIDTRKALALQYQWAAEHDFLGHDPHDTLASPIFSRIRSPFARLVALQLGRRSLIDFRSLLRVPERENAKALALFITGLLQAREAATPDWKADAIRLGERLAACSNERGGWGYPFPWQSRTHFLPAYTPNIVTTSFSGMALIELNAIAPSPTILSAIERSAEYIVRDIPRSRDGVAFGYAANDPQIVFNASLLGAEFLLKAGRLLGYPEYLDLARQSAEFVAKHQNSDGSWAYGLEPSQKWTDSFHTGFVIVSLRSIAEETQNSSLHEAAMSGFEYYVKTFLEPDNAIRYFSNKRYPIDAHALGQAMVTLSEFGEEKKAEHVAQWTVENMRSPQGYFYYQRHRLFTNRIPYIRWSNAWIFRGLSEVVSHA